MPRKCCVPKCNSNYASVLKSQESYVSVFLFPKNEICRQKWINAVHRKNWTPSKNSAVCSKHFRENDIVRYENVVSPEGNIISVRKKFPTLIETAVPTVFPNLPTYLTKPEVSERTNPEERRQKATETHSRLAQAFEESDLIKNFQSLTSCYSEKVQMSDCWNVILKYSKIYFYKPDSVNDILLVDTQIVINEQMEVKVTHKENTLSFNELKWILPVDMKLSR